MYRSSLVDFFTGSHVYPSASELPVGAAVVLSSGSLGLSTSTLDPRVAGIVVSCSPGTSRTATSLGDIGSDVPAYLVKTASVGDSRYRGCPGFNVCNENGAISAGDLLVTSSTPGYLMKQGDDVMRSCTVGKSMETVVFDENGQATGVYGYIYCG